MEDRESREDKEGKEGGGRKHDPSLPSLPSFTSRLPATLFLHRNVFIDKYRLLRYDIYSSEEMLLRKKYKNKRKLRLGRNDACKSSHG